MTYRLGLLVRAGAVLLLCLAAGCAFKDNPPNTPAVPTGPTVVSTDTASYSSSATDPDGDSVCLGFNFQYGDRQADEYAVWTEMGGSGETAGHKFYFYDNGTCRVRVRALDVHGYYSDWSEWLTITVYQTSHGESPAPGALAPRAAAGVGLESE